MCVLGRGDPWSRPRSAWREPAPREFPALKSADQLLPQRQHRERDIEQQTSTLLDDSPSGFQDCLLEATKVPARAETGFELTTQHGSQIERQKREEERHFVLFERR